MRARTHTHPHACTRSLMHPPFLQAAEDQTQEATLSLEDLSSAAVAETDGRVVLDDIDWGPVSQTVGTRSPLQCMDKWYDQLAPSLVAAGAHNQGSWAEDAMNDSQRCRSQLVGQI